MTRKLDYEWLKRPAYKAYELWESEDFIYIKKNGIPIDVYLSSNKEITEGFLERKIKALDLEDQNNVRKLKRGSGRIT